MSLHLRAQLLAMALMLVFVAMLGGVALDIVKSSIKEETTAATKVAVQLLKAGIAPYESDAEVSPATIAYLASLGRVRANELRFLGADGTVLYQSPPSTYKMDRYAPSWFVALVDPRPDPVSIEIRSGLLKIVPDTSRAVVDAWDDTCRLARVVALFFVVTLTVVYWLVGHALRPVKRILAGLADMEQGNFAVRLPESRITEFDRVSHVFNRLAHTLESSLSENRRLEQGQDLERLIRERLEEERRCVARELHDELGQCVTAIRTIAVSITRRTQDSYPEVRDSACTIASVAGQIYDAVHEIINRLRTVDSGPADHAAALRALADSWRACHPEIRLTLTLEDELGLFDDEVGRTVFRIVQESLTNVLRHASATDVGISVRRQGESNLQVLVRDNGCGSATPDRAHGYGVLGMRERVASLGGSFNIVSKPGHGLCVCADLPIFQEQS